MVGWLVNFCICHVRYFCMLFLKRTSKIMGALVPTKPETLGPSAPPGPLTCSRYFSSLPSAPGGELDKPLQAPMTPGFCWTRPVGSHPPPEDWTERKRFLAGRYSPGSSVRSPPVGWVPSLKATAPWLSCGLAVSASPALPWCLRSSADKPQAAAEPPVPAPFLWLPPHTFASKLTANKPPETILFHMPFHMSSASWRP